MSSDMNAKMRGLFHHSRGNTDISIENDEMNTYQQQNGNDGLDEREEDVAYSELSYEDMFAVANEDEMDSDDDGFGEYEFGGSGVNSNYYNHSANASDIASNVFGMDRTTKLGRNRIDPLGYVKIVIVQGDSMKKVTRTSKQEPYIRFNLHGHKAKTVSKSSGGVAPSWDVCDPLNTLSVPLYPTSHVRKDDPHNMLVEVWDESERFIGGGTIHDVNKYPSEPVPYKIALLDESGNAAGTLIVKIGFTSLTIQEKVETRGKHLLELPEKILNASKRVGRGALPILRRLQVTLIDSIKGIASQWDIVLMLILPYILISLLTNFSFALRQWVLIFPISFYCYIRLPLILGRAFSALATASAFHGYVGKFTIRAIHFEPWIDDGKLFFRLCLENITLGNPPGFPFENLMSIGVINVHGHITIEHIKNVIFQRYKPCPLKKVPDFMLLAKLNLKTVDCEDILLDYQMFEGQFNLKLFNRLLAEGEAKDIGWMNGWYKIGDPMPNQLCVKIIRAKNLLADNDPKALTDPFVVVKCRRDIRTTHTQTKTRNPMFNEEFYFHVEDPATIVQVIVYNRTPAGTAVMIGQWIMTLKWMLADPYHCWHENGLEVSDDRKMKGWFPLQGRKWNGLGSFGVIEMHLHWHHVKEKDLQNRYEPPPMAALAQYEEIFNETLLRWGSFTVLRNWLSRFPILVSAQRISARNIEFHMEDLFRGYKGKAESSGADKAAGIEIKLLEWFWLSRIYPGDEGITVWDAWMMFFKETALSAVGIAGSSGAVTQITASTIKQFSDHWRYFFKGEFDKIPTLTMAKQAQKNLANRFDSAYQHAQRSIINLSNDSQFKVPVSADDNDFLLDQVDLGGYLERSARAIPKGIDHMTDELLDKEIRTKRSVTFKKKYFELKGHTLFFRKQKTLSEKSLFKITYKIDLRNVTSAIFYPNFDEIVLNQEIDGHITRLRLPREGTIIQDNPSLAQWYEEFIRHGVQASISNLSP